MSKEATDRYSVKVEIPITIILETIFSDDNEDVETLSRWALKYGFVDFVKDDGKYGSYHLQDDYNKQDFYVWLSKEERNQYDYENYLIDEVESLKNIIKEAIEYLKEHAYYGENTQEFYRDLDYIECLELLEILDKVDKDEK